MYRDDGHPRDLAVDPEELLASQRRLRKKQLAGLAAALVALGAIAACLTLFLERKARAAKEHAWSRAAMCIAGSGAGTPGARARDAQLVAMGVPPERRVAPGFDGWPDRCAPPLHAFAEAVKEGGETDLEEASEKLATTFANGLGVTADLAPLIDDLFAKAAAESLVAVPAADLPEPARATPMVLATLPKEARMFVEQVPLASIRRSPIADLPPRFVVDDSALKRGPALCTFVEASRSIACTKVPGAAAAMSPALRLWGTTAPGASPFVFAGDRGRSGIFRADTGARVVDRLEYGAYGASALDDGSLGYLVWHESPPETHFVRVAADGSRAESAVVSRRESSNPYYTTSMFWSHVVYKSVRPGAEGIRLMVRDVAPSGALGPPVDVGRIAEAGQIEGGEDEDPHLTGCRAGDTTVIRAKGWSDTYLSFFVAGKWTVPVEARGLGGDIACRPGEAILSRVLGGRPSKTAVRLQRCTVSGCDDWSFDVNKVIGDNRDTLPRDARAVRVADIDGRILLAWFAGERGGLRLRFARPGELGSAPDMIFYDDHVRDGRLGQESTMVDFDLVPTAHGALMLFGAIDGVFAFHFDATGKATPVTTTLE